jgi:hypothetical protein
MLLVAELFLSEMSPMKWSDLEALGWKKRRYDARTQRYSYVTPVRSSKTRIILQRGGRVSKQYIVVDMLGKI